MAGDARVCGVSTKFGTTSENKWSTREKFITDIRKLKYCPRFCRYVQSVKKNMFCNILLHIPSHDRKLVVPVPFNIDFFSCFSWFFRSIFKSAKNNTLMND